MVSWIAKVLCVMVICGMAAGEDPIYPDDEIVPIVTGVEHPLPVLTEPLQKAERVIEDIVCGNETDHMLFLGDWWPVPLNNSSVLNLTA